MSERGVLCTQVCTSLFWPLGADCGTTSAAYICREKGNEWAGLLFTWHSVLSAYDSSCHSVVTLDDLDSWEITAVFTYSLCKYFITSSSKVR